MCDNRLSPQVGSVDHEYVTNRFPDPNSVNAVNSEGFHFFSVVQELPKFLFACGF
jgi:hypothetical protein